MRFRQIVTINFTLLILSGCTLLTPMMPQPQPQAQPENKVRPAGPLPPSTRPTYNLTGYPAATKEGYIDGCETAKKTRYGQKDKARYASDGQYQMGWNDGFDLCQRKPK